MTILLIIFYYLATACIDVLDKFLLSARKIRPLPYAFYTVVMGLVLLIAWPWFYQPLMPRAIFFDALSGAMFSAAIYVFFKALSDGEASRVIPFVFGLVPLTDLVIGLLTGRNLLAGRELAALCLLIPGAILISFRKNQFFGHHIALKVLSAFLWSGYYALWQFAAQAGGVMNHLMWNRLGAAAVFVGVLVLPSARKNIFGLKEVKNKQHTSILFLLKQFAGGTNFIFLSFLLVIAKISVVNGLQGFRYIFLLGFSLVFNYFHQHILEEQMDKHAIWQKLCAIGLIFAGTVVLFI